MSTIPHLPVIRLGRNYASLEQTEVNDFRTGEVCAVVSSMKAGIVKKTSPSWKSPEPP